jgi:hypothetical protein
MDKSVVDAAFETQELSPEQHESMEKIKERAKELTYTILDECPSCADRSAALRKLREAVMTVNTAISLQGLI